jgi:diadenosine tetraphosphate (Ap4A) HIT family hydrolase
MDCFICRKHAGQEAQPPGGYFDLGNLNEYWRVCHAPPQMAVPGMLLIESQRHVLDFAEMTPEEASSYGILARRLYAALKTVTGAPRIYALAMMDGAEHFHMWLVPRPADALSKGIAYLAADHACTEQEALTVVAALREQLARE